MIFLKNIGFVTFLFLSGCGLIAVEVTGVVSNGCAWISPIYLTESSITALRTAQTVNPEVRIDRENIVRHNKLYEEFCLEKGTKAN